MIICSLRRSRRAESNGLRGFYLLPTSLPTAIDAFLSALVGLFRHEQPAVSSCVYLGRAVKLLLPSEVLGKEVSQISWTSARLGVDLLPRWIRSINYAADSCKTRPRRLQISRELIRASILRRQTSKGPKTLAATACLPLDTRTAAADSYSTAYASSRLTATAAIVRSR